MADLAMTGGSPATNTDNPPKGPIYWLATLAAITTIALTAAAFWLSYEHLHDVADANGLHGARAWAWPGTVDLFIVAGELLILRAALRGRFDWFAYLLAGVGSLGSIALNVAGVGADAQPMEYVVAAVPPSAALIAFAALMRQVHDALARTAETPAEQPAPPLPKRAPGVALAELATETAPEQGETGEQHDEPDASRRLLTTGEVADRYGVRPSTVGTWVSRGKLAPALKDPSLGNLYDPETLPEIT